MGLFGRQAESVSWPWARRSADAQLFDNSEFAAMKTQFGFSRESVGLKCAPTEVDAPLLWFAQRAKGGRLLRAPQLQSCGNSREFVKAQRAISQEKLCAWNTLSALGRWWARWRALLDHRHRHALRSIALTE
jgi:hypothetical protein